jgi:hypothetical protein
VHSVVSATGVVNVTEVEDETAHADQEHVHKVTARSQAEIMLAMSAAVARSLANSSTSSQGTRSGSLYSPLTTALYADSSLDLRRSVRLGYPLLLYISGKNGML